jgi:penicillin-binding protein 2
MAMNDGSVSRYRFVILRVFILVSFAIISVRLWDLQIISAAKYTELADRNRYRLVPIDAPRGIIYDRYGRILVRNVPSFAVSIVPASLPGDETERRKLLERVSELINQATPSIDDTAYADTASRPAENATAPEREGGRLEMSIEAILAERTISPYAPVRIASDVDRQAAFIIEEEQLDLPGVLIQVEPLRHYADGPLTAHLLGYVGNIPSEATILAIRLG